MGTFIHRQRIAALATLLLCTVPPSWPPLRHSARDAAPTVTLGNTSVVGRSYNFAETVDLEFFGGIPFAEPPARFAPPVYKDTLSNETFDASAYGLPCPQLGINNGTEDCLKLNILRPANANSSEPLPVMVWIFGGGFKSGFADKFNGSTLVAQSVDRGTPMIYVNFNYRVGPWGFPQGSEAIKEGALNLGLKDQLTALTWVKNRISAFGGDPSKITVFGSSAGAISIAGLYLNSGLENLVRATITGSGFTGTTPVYNATRRQQEWNNFVLATPACALKLPGDTFDCMRKVDLSTLISAYTVSSKLSLEQSQFVPVIDGEGGIIPDIPSKLISEGKFSKIPLITGANLDDGTFFTPQWVSNDLEIELLLTEGALPWQLTPPPPPFLNALDRVLALYPKGDPAAGSPYGTGNETFGLSPEYKRLASIIGDANFHAPRRAWVHAAANVNANANANINANVNANANANANVDVNVDVDINANVNGNANVNVAVPVYAFVFADPAAVANASLGVTHGTDVPYFYGAPFTQAGPSAPTAQGELSLAMMDYVISFVVGLDPNDGRGSQPPNWPQYTADNQVLLQFASLNTMVIPDDYRAEQIAYLNSVSSLFGQ